MHPTTLLRRVLPVIFLCLSGRTMAQNVTPLLTVMPIDWLSFRAFPDGQVVNLDWSTTYDGVAVPYVIERSPDGQTWSAIGTVPGIGGKLAQMYTYTDSLPLNGWNYYKLLRTEQIDSPQVSAIVSVQIAQSRMYVVSPNPVRNTLHLSRLSPSSGQLGLRLLTLDGRIAKQAEWSLTSTDINVPLDIQGLPSGLYFLEIVDNKGIHPQKVLVL